MQAALWEIDFVLLIAGKSKAARIAIVAITTSSSIREKPRLHNFKGILAWVSIISLYGRSRLYLDDNYSSLQ